MIFGQPIAQIRGRQQRLFGKVGALGLALKPLSPTFSFSQRDLCAARGILGQTPRELGIGWVNWQVLRRSYATWLKMAGADIKDAQALMRHSRASTTPDIYQQFVPESQRKVVESLGRLTNLTSVQ